MKQWILFSLWTSSFCFGQQWKATAMEYGNVNEIAARNGTLFAATSTGLFVSYDGGNRFFSVTLPAETPQYTYSFAAVGDSLFVSTGQGVLVSTTDDTVWTKVNSSPSSGYMYSHGGNLFMTNAGVYRSTDRGGTWQSAGSIPASFLNGEFSSIGNNVFYGSGSSGFYRSTDGGANWLQSNAGLGKDTSIQSLSSISGTLIVSTTTSPSDSNIVYASADSGRTWQRTARQPVSGMLQSLYVAGENIFGGAYGKLYRSTDGGLSWVNAGTGLSTSISYFSSFAVVGDTLYAGSNVGIWKRKLSDFGITSAAGTGRPAPADFMLSQNYPNPFNPSTTIEFRVTAGGPVRLGVYDLLGRETALLVDEWKQPGTYKVRFNASRLSSGIYLYRIRSGALAATKRMHLIK